MMTLTEKPNIQENLIPVLKTVSDPEIPVLSVLDLGVIREAVEKDGIVQIKLTPTYSGCPAMDVIADDLKKAFSEIGKNVEVELVLSPAWSTDWISEEGLQKMEEYGIARPLSESHDKDVLLGEKKLVKCPQCGSTNTHLSVNSAPLPAKHFLNAMIATNRLITLNV